MKDEVAPVEPVRDILIVGGGAAGWMTAAVLARTLPPQRYRIGLIDTPPPPGGIEQLDAGEASLPPIAAVHELLGVGDEVLLRGTDATYSLGARFEDFARPGTAYFRAFGTFGTAIEGVAFHNLFERMRRKGLAATLEEHSLAVVAAKLDRFAPPSADPDSLLSSYDHAWHWDGASYRRMLRAAAEHARVSRIEGAVGEVVLRGTDGFVEAVRLDDGRRLAADLFIDCTPDGLLIEGRLESGWEDWRHWLPCDRILATRCERAGDPPPYWQAQAHGAGWRWRIPMLGSDGVGQVYSSAFAGDDEAEAGLRAAIGGARANPPRVARFASGRRKRMWIANCVAIGAAACVLDPLEPTALQLVQDAIGALLSLMPRKACDAGEAEDFNRLMSDTADRMRDYLILRYHANARAEPFWTERRAAAVPDPLAYKLRLFEANGRVIEWDEESFFEADWVAAYLGQEVRPRHYDALADVPDAKLIRDRMTKIRKAIQAAVQTMPTHRAYIELRLANRA